MWISERTAQSGKFEASDIAVGIVSIGGARPSVEVDGEQRSARLASSGVFYVPAAGDEVLVLKDSEGESFVLGKASENALSGTEQGEVLINAGKKSLIRLRRDGTLELSGDIFISGTTHIDGELFINGGICEKSLTQGE